MIGNWDRRLAALLLAGSAPALAAPVAVPMSAARWHGDKVAFDQPEGFPAGRMTVSEGLAMLDAATFGEGTVEFDMKPLAFADTGILLHRRDADTAEFVYVRADPDCPAANDCVQYAPITNGRMQWNVYPDYQNGASIAEKGWNHLRLVIGGGRLRLYVNSEREPSLDVPRLQGLAADGGIAVKGPAVFANLVLRPDDRGDAAPSPVRAVVPGTIVRWSLGPVTAAPADCALAASDAPSAGWRPLEAEPNGLANLARVIPKSTSATLSVAWLRVRITAATAGERTLALGFATRVRLFVNGRPAYAGENLYYPGDRRLQSEGRLAPDNARVPIILRKGDNELLLAVDDAWRTSNGVIKPTPYGWAAMARFVDPAGLRLGS